MKIEQLVQYIINICKENEIKRRLIRTKQLNRTIKELYDEKISSQYRVNILTHEKEFDLVITNNEDFDYEIDNKKVNFT